MDEVMRIFEVLSRLFGELKVIKQIPEDLQYGDEVINRAIEIRTASMKYIAVTIHHLSTPFGTIGNYTTLNEFQFSRQSRQRLRLRR